MALRPWKNPLDFVGDLDHVILGLGSVRVMVYVPCHTSRTLLWLGEDQVVPTTLQHDLVLPSDCLIVIKGTAGPW